MSAAKYVIVDGPFAEQDRYGDEYPVWYVYIGDNEGYGLDGKTYTVSNFDRAFNLAERIAKDRHLELVNEASPA